MHFVKDIFQKHEIGGIDRLEPQNGGDPKFQTFQESCRGLQKSYNGHPQEPQKAHRFHPRYTFALEALGIGEDPADNGYRAPQ